MQSWLEHFGYVAIFIGTFLEGETILVLAGFAAHQGYMGLPGVVAAAFGGSLFGDQLFFYLGRKHSDFLIRHRPKWQPRIERAQRLIHNYRTIIIVTFRFLYGLRTVTPFALGMSHVSPRLFIPLNVLGALLWATAFGYAGYLFGQAMGAYIGDLKRYELWGFAALIGAGLVVWLIRWFVGKKRHEKK